MAPNIRRSALFFLWTLFAAAILLEAILQVGARFIVGDAADPILVEGEELLSGQGPVLLTVGDSWVEGAEAPDGEGFVDVLGEILKNKYDVKTVNLGRNGSNSAHVALTVMDIAPRLKPKLVLVLVGQNNASNFYRVAEVEERIGSGKSQTRIRDQLRTVKLARILWANIQGSSGYATAAGTQELHASPVPPRLDEFGCAEGYVLHRAQDDGFDGWVPCADPNDAVHQLLVGVRGRAYLFGGTPPNPDEGPPATSRAAARPFDGGPIADIALELLLATAQRKTKAWGGLEKSVRASLGRAAGEQSPSIAAPAAKSPEEILAHYALMRLGRERKDWKAVRRHGGALLKVTPHNLLSNLGSAEALLLAGDWRGARTHLIAAHGRAPGFADVLDLAGRFPKQAMNGAVYEALEFSPYGRLPAFAQARLQEALSDPQGAAETMKQWLNERPEDLNVSADLAVWLIGMGQSEAATGQLELVGPADGAQPEPAPEHRKSSAHWRLALAWAGETGDPKAAEDAYRAGIEELGEYADSDFLEAGARLLADYELCEALPAAVLGWYEAAGKAPSAAQLLRRCMPAGEAVELLEFPREAWGPLGSKVSWQALVKAGHQPFDLLFRDLDLVMDATAAVGGSVLVLNYPNPSEDHVVLREVLADYAGKREVEVLDLFGLFSERFSAEEWAAHMAPNGHCNARGYRVMAEAIAEHVDHRSLF